MLLKHLFEDLIGLLFPDLCCGCKTYLYRGEQQICTRCLHKLPYTDYHHYKDNKAAKQLWGRIPCNAVMSLLYFKKGGRTQNIIHSLKYNGRMDLGEKLGNMIAQKIITSRAYDHVDLIIPVPLHRDRAKIRGYNQSLCIAIGIAQVLKVPINTSCLVRNKRTESQTRKGRYKRFENMLDVFSISDASEIDGKHILLVDDVITTGATLEACGMILLSNKIGKLSIATVAFAE